VVKKAATLIELIFVIVILSILSAGTFVALNQLYIRSAKSKALSELSLDSQIVTCQISELLQKRVPSTLIGYDPQTQNFQSIYTASTASKVIEWIGTAKESFKRRDFSGFIDLNNSSRPVLVSLNTNGDKIGNTLKAKFGITTDIYTNHIINLIFAGAFDEGGLDSADFNNSFGWHGGDSNQTFDITISSDGNITITDSKKPDIIYEKYYLVDSAYAIAKGSDIDTSRDCIKNLAGLPDDLNNTLFLFYNYRPWKNETFCADPNTDIVPAKEGNVTILSTEVSFFEVHKANSNLIINLSLQRSIPKRSNENNITISKQKVIF